MMDFTVVEISSACLQQVTFKLRDYQELNIKDRIQKEQLRLPKAFKQEKAGPEAIVIQCITANFAQIMTRRFTGEDLGGQSFLSGCCLQHYASTDTSKSFRSSGFWSLGFCSPGSSHLELFKF